MYLSLPTLLPTDPLLTLQVHSGAIALCCNEHAVVEVLTHNPSPYEVSVATWYHLIEHHGRVVEARIEAADHTNVHPLRKMPVQSTEQSMNAVREAVAQARADEQAQLLGGPGQYDRLTGRKATARTPEADLVDEAHRFDYIRAAVEDEHSHPSIDAGPDGPVTPTTW